ncbi:hypothetical protein K461DRAFT_233152 [Myriangium duriaei CBS 260.36]|uniref:Carrier domain-containing protein n=1 Tax=Myriangium duriaei CBS 260.36 TaxID=1168546 RepID=A0A9P4IQL3_9PEZI|nr:hypothetical protein K461DRAFT_233152 [Myriangium duriaei CBS 260.36]
MSSQYADKSEALAGLSCTGQPSIAALRSLSTLLESSSGHWPVFELQCYYARAWKHLPEAIKAGAGSLEDAALVSEVEQQIKASYSDMLSLIPVANTPALKDSQSQTSLTHKALSTFIRGFKLPCGTSGTAKPRIALALPNGPLLGLAILTITTYFICCPLSVASGPEQFKSDLCQSGASIVFVTSADVKRLGLSASWVKESSIEVVIIRPEQDMTFSMDCMDEELSPGSTNGSMWPELNKADDVALMLFTSGTSGTKKTVPITVHSLVSGIAFVIESWGLKSHDVCLNMMPLFHVGGIVRNLFAPIMAGGATICCPAFDANAFWDIVEDHAPTWYYASPTMHQLILDTSKYRQDALAKSNLRLICNAAGGLLPSLACNLHDTFNCTVLPSYGMTECMPISSPPLDYKLDRSGTSGVSVGPDLAILDGKDDFLPAGEVGRIAVRGAPLFGGYLKDDGSIDTSPFTKSRFFDTGDLGYLDQDGYLYVTGRSKEVINRGGELISPFEVEEAVLSASQQSGSPIEGRVSAVLAFSMPHSVLQETVGLVVVTPPGARRVCIKTVQAAVKDSLSQVKWPQVLVYMDDLPKNNNKVLRIKLGQRMDMPDLSDDVLLADRHYNAVCPPPNTPLGEKIATAPCLSDLDAVSKALYAAAGPNFDVYVRTSATCGYPEGVLAPVPELKLDCLYSANFDPIKMIKGQLEDMNIPIACHLLDIEFPIDEQGDIDRIALEKMIADYSRAPSMDGDFGLVESKVATMFAQILACPKSELRKDSDFFALGGDSIRAGRLLSELRRESNARVPVDLLFTRGQISTIAEYIESTISPIGTEKSSGARPVDTETVIAKTCSSTNPFLLMTQLIPIVLVYPMKRALTWTIFMYALAETQFWSTSYSVPGRLFNLVISLSIGRLISFLLAPLFGIFTKWMLIGKYQEGLYPMWGFYHTRWWLVQKILSICGKGHFGMSNSGLVLYYRLLGAKIGTKVTINEAAILGEYDLLEIDDGANLDKCTCRGFAAEKNTAMYLGRIKIGKNASVGLNSVVAPGTIVPDNACIGANSSSWEMTDANESNRNLSASKIPNPNFFLSLLVNSAFSLFVNTLRVLPWMFGLLGLVLIGPEPSKDKVMTVIDWFAQPYRIGFHYLALILHSYLGPMTWFLAIFIAKKFIDSTFGKQRPGRVEARNMSQKLRMSLMKTLVDPRRFHKLVDLFGAHYEVTSILYRLLGAKIGQRVYWPGTGPEVQDFDLLDIGDDVVFGSRSHIVTSDGYGSEVVKVGSGSMISDRVVLLPGTQVSESTVFGSGALSRRDKYYPANTVWVGSRAGEAVCLSDNRPKRSIGTLLPRRSSSLTHMKRSLSISRSKRSLDISHAKRSFSIEKGQLSSKRALIITEEALPELPDISDLESGTSTPRTMKPKISTDSMQTPTSPFGRAFYSNLATYRVWGLPTIMLYSSLITIFTAFYWNVASTSSVQLLAIIFPHLTTIIPPTSAARPFVIFGLFTALISLLQTTLAIIALFLTISAKWLLLGRRTPGNYNWDTSPYCQRWQLYLTIERLRRQCYGPDGILGLLTGTHYLTLYFRSLGAKIGKDCALFAGGKASCLFTEPDLLTLGDRVAVDDASLVGHINSRGVFDLNELHVGEGSVLRSGSRLLSGAKMGKGAVLMEHTLVMAGDEVEDHTARQGWPSEVWEGRRMPTLAREAGGEKV